MILEMDFTCMYCSMQNLRKLGHTPRLCGPKRPGEGVTVRAMVVAVKDITNPGKGIYRMAVARCPQCQRKVTRLLPKNSKVPTING